MNEAVAGPASAGDRISLVNHASVLIESGGIGLLSDPWYRGSAFNEGWSLVWENPEADIAALLERVTHLFLSHEHPDHFSVDFFNRHAATLKARGVTVLFQATRDRRIAGFLSGRFGLTVRELADGEWLALADGVRVCLHRCGAIDSALVVETAEASYLNLNDCDFDDADVRRIARGLSAKPRISFNQFSYAAWRGSLEWMRKAADYKLARIAKDHRLLAPQVVIPFASFVYFSHEENRRLNEGINRPADVAAFGERAGVPVTVLPPWPAGFATATLLAGAAARAEVQAQGLAFWSPRYAPEAFRYRPVASEAVMVADADIEKYTARIRRGNNLGLMALIRALTFGRVFGDVRLRLPASGEDYRLSFRGVERLGPAPAGAPADVALAGDSLLLLLRTEYGLDTLSVNGRFTELHGGGFNRLVFALGFMTLNAAGFGINFRSLLDRQVLKRILLLPLRVLMKRS